ncbi:MAG: hypothetical protein BM557_00910 [Flavobacterium sp. MedPE-SWcel]|uniref:hypothetical protein n=1 Tax=uncultured Flavobacterium sp. TaxID=165435 RepID=UPI0009109A70|nr:hypothetical protein [uncultured Flavobacterium sp.]OIQ22579.1 MAG: hypothetical protein BM557_00910 [Flavobacterium sp. MedPE-SWcel]
MEKVDGKTLTLESNGVLIHSVTGDLFLSDNEKEIQADLFLKVSDIKFKYGNYHYTVEVEEAGVKYKGIVFNYFHGTDPVQPDLGIDNHDTPIKFDFDNSSIGWKESDKVRVMILNEDNHQDFADMKLYFEEYLREFKYRKDVTTQEFNAFNTKWNNHPNNNGRRINSRSRVNKLIEEFKSSNKSLDVYDIIKIAKALPRFTKDGGVLTLKFRR